MPMIPNSTIEATEAEHRDRLAAVCRQYDEQIATLTREQDEARRVGLERYEAMRSERDASRASEARLRAALEASRVNMIVSACNGRCLCGNDEWLTEHNGGIDDALAGAPASGEWVAYVEPGRFGQFDSDPLLDDTIVERHDDEVMLALDSHRFSPPAARALAAALLSAAREGT